MLGYSARLLVMVYVHCGTCLDEIWIQTLDSGNVDATKIPDVFNYYTNLSNYHILPSQNQFRISVKACHDAFILLTAAKDLQSPDFYEIGIGARNNNSTVLRRNFSSNNVVSTLTPGTLSCTNRTTFLVSWEINGQITLKKETSDRPGGVFRWTDTTSFPIINSINGIGIMIGYGADGIWTVEYASIFIGHYCGAPNRYGSMNLLSTSKQLSRMMCLSTCSPNSACLGVNYNQQSNECELVSGGQVIEKSNKTDWSFYTKCLNGTKVCLGCLVD